MIQKKNIEKIEKLVEAGLFEIRLFSVIIKGYGTSRMSEKNIETIRKDKKRHIVQDQPVQTHDPSYLSF